MRRSHPRRTAIRFERLRHRATPTFRRASARVAAGCAALGVDAGDVRCLSRASIIPKCWRCCSHARACGRCSCRSIGGWRRPSMRARAERLPSRGLVLVAQFRRTRSSVSAHEVSVDAVACARRGTRRLDDRDDVDARCCTTSRLASTRASARAALLHVRDRPALPKASCYRRRAVLECGEQRAHARSHGRRPMLTTLPMFHVGGLRHPDDAGIARGRDRDIACRSSIRGPRSTRSNASASR